MAVRGKNTKAKSNQADNVLSLDDCFPRLREVAGDLEKKGEAAARSADICSLLGGVGLGGMLAITGTSSLRIKRFLEWIKEKLFRNDRGIITSYFGSELGSASSLEPLIGALTNASLFSRSQLVLLLEADRLKVAQAKKLAEALPRRTKSTLFIAVFKEADDKSVVFKEFAATGFQIALKDLDPEGLRKWILVEASRLLEARPPITAEAANLLAGMYGDDLDALAAEINKLSLLCNRDKPIGLELVQSLSVRSPEHTSFELVADIAKRNILGSAILQHDLVNQGFHPLQLNGFLSKAIRTILAQKEEHGGRRLHPELSNPWFQKSLRGSSANFTVDALRNFLKQLRRLDLELKSNNYPAEVVLSTTTTRMASRT